MRDEDNTSTITRKFFFFFFVVLRLSRNRPCASLPWLARERERAVIPHKKTIPPGREKKTRRAATQDDPPPNPRSTSKHRKAIVILICLANNSERPTTPNLNLPSANKSQGEKKEKRQEVFSCLSPTVPPFTVIRFLEFHEIPPPPRKRAIKRRPTPCTRTGTAKTLHQRLRNRSGERERPAAKNHRIRNSFSSSS